MERQKQKQMEKEQKEKERLEALEVQKAEKKVNEESDKGAGKGSFETDGEPVIPKKSKFVSLHSGPYTF